MKLLNIVTYEKQSDQMGDLLARYGAFPVKDILSNRKRERVKRKLEKYLSGKKPGRKIFHIRKSFFIEVHGFDSAGHLYEYFK